MDNYTLLHAISALWRDLGKIMGWIFSTVLIVGLVTLIIPKTYTSKGKVFVRLGRENASLDATTTLGEHPVVAMPLTREFEINSVTSMIQNRTIVERIVDEVGPGVILKKEPLHPDSDKETESPFSKVTNVASGAIDSAMAALTVIGAVDDITQRERAIIRIQKNLTVEPLEKSNVIQIEFDSHDPELSQLIVQRLIDEYSVSHGEIHRNSSAYSFLESQTRRVETTLRDCEKEFEQFKNYSGIVEIEQSRKSLMNRISDIQDRKLENDALLAGVEHEISQLKKSISDTPANVVIEKTQGVGQEGVDGMREVFFQLEVRQAQLAAKYSETHPEVIQISQQMEQARKIIDAAEKGRVETVEGVNKVFTEIRVELIKKESEQAGLSMKSTALQKQLEGLNNTLAEFNSNETKFLRLKRKCFIEDAAYRKYANNLEQARIDQLLQSSNISNISVAQPATRSQKPAKPRKLINLLLAFSFGSMIGIGITLLKDIRRWDANHE